MSPNKKGLKTSIHAQVEALKTEDANVVKSKNVQTREEIRWKIKGVKDKYLDELNPRANRNIKRPIFKKHQIVMTELHEYPELEWKFNDYVLAWMSKTLSSYQQNLIRGFFANYLALAEKDYPKGSKIPYFPNR